MITVPDFYTGDIKPGVDPVRAPIQFWKEYGIKFDTDEERLELKKRGWKSYAQEWDPSSEHVGVEDVARVAESVGLGDANARLNHAVGNVIGFLCEYDIKDGPVKILSVGEGALTTYGIVSQHFSNRDIEYYAVEPAGDSFNLCRDTLGYRRAFNCVDRGILSLLEDGIIESDFDIVIANAGATHHNPDQRDYYRVANRTLREGGWCVDGDWCSFWNHPFYVAKLLEDIGRKDLHDDFIEAIPGSTQRPKIEDEREVLAVERFHQFWREYHDSGARYHFFVPEGIIPREWKLDALQDSGFETDNETIRQMENEGIINETPHILDDEDSIERNGSLHCVSIGRKTDDVVIPWEGVVETPYLL